MQNDETRQRLANAKSVDEVKDILKGRPDIVAEQAWKEIENHRSGKNELLDLNELDAVSGGTEFRDWTKDGCAATCEDTSWCGSNDWCYCWDVTYDNFWATCPDGHEHEFNDCLCVRCGYYDSNHSWTPDEAK